jgi:molybdenum-dependent DNA-binding transcriptional regulator ModE
MTTTGGKKGGGAIVTGHGERAIDLFWKFNQEFLEFLEIKTNMITFEEEGR